MVQLKWEEIKQDRAFYLYKAKVPGGWLVACTDDVLDQSEQLFHQSGWEWRTSITYVPDPLGVWK
jgi:hypothetical protein